ncbi:HAD-IIA family hydrolase [Citricoccus sp. GCM10030269]|uniref:HAD-IIA family hydrolase n=1 Tax=Citricoccus sp. GCM10030269 TaxID=3273388 RepID=UPI00361D79E5
MVGTTFFGGHDALLCDLDGVVYAGAEAIDEAVPSLVELGRRGVPVAYVTNNASRSPEAVADHLSGFGLPVSGEQVFGAAAAGVALLSESLAESLSASESAATRPDSPASVLVVGSAYLRDLVTQAGHQVVDTAADRPDAVIQGFDPSVSWTDLAQASYAIRGGAQWIATNADLTIPRAEGIAPGNGALVEAVSQATGTRPRVAGKPGPVLFELAVRAFNAESPLVVGDRLDTDILGGNRAGFDTALVLTGVDSGQTAATAPDEQQPTWMIPSLASLLADPQPAWSASNTTVGARS